MTYRALIVDGGCAVASWKAAGSLDPFVERVLRLRDLYEPGTAWVAWDCPRTEGWRRVLAPSYKANRAPMEEGLTDALAEVRDVLAGLGVLQVEAPGAEADDLLYSLSVALPGPVLLASADKDLVQSVRVGVDLLRLGVRSQDMLITAEALRSAGAKLAGRWIAGFDGPQWADLLALAGDATDGVPGLPGVGPHKAEAILRACPRFVDLVLAGDDQAARCACTADATTARWVEVAIAHREDLRLSRELTRLRLVEYRVTGGEL